MAHADGFFDGSAFSGEGDATSRSQWSSRDVECEPALGARAAALAATTCSHPDGFIRLDGLPQTYDFGDGESETLQAVTCLCCTASFSRVVVGS